MMKQTLLLAAFLLSACSSNTERSGLDIVRNLVSPEAYTPPARFTELFQQERAILDVEFIDLGVAGKLILEQQDGAYARYLSSDLGGIVLQNGMLHSLYGFGEPLIAADLSQPLSLVLSSNSGRSDRFHTYVTGNDETLIRTYRCQVNIVGRRSVDLATGPIPTTLMSENCQSLTNSFENLYWVDANRRQIIQSRQWIGDNIGSMVTRISTP